MTLHGRAETSKMAQTDPQETSERPDSSRSNVRRAQSAPTLPAMHAVLFARNIRLHEASANRPLDLLSPKDSNSGARLHGGSMQTVRHLLEQLGLSQYSEIFAENDVDLEALRLLSDVELEKVGVSLGHRKKLLKATAELNGSL